VPAGGITLDQPDATNEKMSELNPSIDPSTMKEMALAQKPLIELQLAASKADLGKMQPVRWTELEDQLRKMKVIDKKSPLWAVLCRAMKWKRRLKEDPYLSSTTKSELREILGEGFAALWPRDDNETMQF
jgi:hypothetical protein